MSLNINKIKTIPALLVVLFSLSFGQVNLALPPNNAIYFNNTPFFDWSDEVGAIAYCLQADDAIDFSSPFIDTVTSNSECQIDYSITSSESCYVYWRVRVEDPLGDWCEPYSFIVINKPTVLIYPTPDAMIQDRTPTFLWHALTGASLYQLTVMPSGSTTPIIDTVISGTTFTPEIMLPLNDYGWNIRAKDNYDYWGVPTETWAFTIIEIPPAIPILLAPENTSSVVTMPQTLVWSRSENAVLYHLVVGTLNIDITDTTYTAEFPRGVTNWKVRAQNEYGVWSGFSSEWTFSVLLPAWVEKESMPSGTNPKKKNVKDGGSLVAVGNDFYALRGNSSQEFYKYDGAWTAPNALESMPYGHKPGEPTKNNKKAVGKGASLCYDGDSLIYATKGNGTKELWVYNIYTDTWILKSFVPVVKGLKGGTSIVYHNEKVYMLAGGQKPAYKNFFSYNTLTAVWDSLDFAPLNTGKPYKDGSCIALLGNNIYALQAGANENYFSMYDINTGVWTPKEYVPLTHPNTPRKKNKVKNGAAMTSDGQVIYAIKGGKVNEFWRYTPGTSSGVWDGLESIPRRNVNPKYNQQSMPNTGAALACNSYGSVYLIKGNGTNEFWKYYPSRTPNEDRIITNPNQSIQNITKPTKTTVSLQIAPNPISENSTIRYTIANYGKVMIKLYNVNGRLVKTLQDTYLDAGTYQLNLSSQALAKGIYFLHFTNNSEQINTKLIVE